MTVCHGQVWLPVGGPSEHWQDDLPVAHKQYAPDNRGLDEEEEGEGGHEDGAQAEAGDEGDRGDGCGEGGDEEEVHGRRVDRGRGRPDRVRAAHYHPPHV